MTAVEFESVTKSFGATEVLKHIDLSVPAGCITAVVGESGSGKSTLLEHVNGLIRPDTGSVRVWGEPLEYGNLDAVRRNIGYAVQGVGLFPHLTIFENVTLLARLQKWEAGRVRERCETLMRIMELPAELSARYPGSLSGGQQQRAGICRALMLKPDLVLLDEPFSGVDPITRRAIHAEFLELREAEGATVVLVTHDMDEALHLGSHLVVIRDGRIVQSGAPEVLTRSPADDYVSRLLSGRTQP